MRESLLALTINTVAHRLAIPQLPAATAKGIPEVPWAYQKNAPGLNGRLGNDKDLTGMATPPAGADAIPTGLL